MSSPVRTSHQSRCTVGSVVAFLFLMMSEASAGQAQPAAAGQAPPAPPATDCAKLLPKVDPAGPPPAAGVRRRRALLVGISQYEKLGSGKGWPSLRTSCDVELMRQVLVSRFGFQDGDIKRLTEGEATKENIVRAFHDHLIKDAGRRDVVVFYTSTHGQLVPDEEAFGGLRGSLVTANYTTGVGKQARMNNLCSDEIRKLLRELKGKMADADGKVDGNITVLFDSCHSGGGTKGELQAKGRPWEPAIDGEIPQPKPGLGNKGQATRRARSATSTATRQSPRGTPLSRPAARTRSPTALRRGPRRASSPTT